MTERFQGYESIDALIERIASGERPIDQFLARCLTEMYHSGQYGSSIVSGTKNPDEKRILSAIRIVAIRHEGLDSVVLTMEHNKNAQRRVLDQMVVQTRQLPTDANSMALLRTAALSEVREAGLVTVTAMQVSPSASTQAEILEVIYPKLYGELFPTREEYKRDLAFGVAVHFLKTVPFGKGNITFPTPSH
jgi:hypothetical protein